MPYRVITISREFGSGGRTIGKRVADQLGIPCYDADLIQKIAEESGYTADYIKEEGEYAKNYHVCLDGGELGIEECADLICHLYSRKM